ncbi:hypothetical protein PG990_000270 [Apiospora arundinis]
MAYIPTFEPVGPRPRFTDQDRDSFAEARIVEDDIALLNRPTFSPHVPYSWGFTIYRDVPLGQEQDVRFTKGVRRLNEWMRWKIRSCRYTDEDLTRYESRPERMPQPQEHDRWDDVADRLWNEVVEEYPNVDRVGTTVLGGEDFTPVGEAFVAWVAGVEGLDTSRRNARYDLCLIIDETVLQMLVDLPAETPPLEAPVLKPKLRYAEPPLATQQPGQQKAHDLCRDTWVWMLDRGNSKYIACISRFLFVLFERLTTAGGPPTVEIYKNRYIQTRVPSVGNGQVL